jgi:hypothetical protein
MANEGNLMPPFNEWDSPEIVREINAKGGRKAGETKRKRKAMRDIIDAFMGYRSELSDSEVAEYESMGLPIEDINNQAKAIRVQMKKAAEGDLNALAFLRDTVGEKPRENMGLTHELVGETKLILWKDNDGD